MIIHPATKRQFDSLIEKTPHAILIAGPQGSGKSYIAEQLVEKLLKVTNLENHPYVLHIYEDDMTIDAVRKIRSFLGKKTTGSQSVRRAVILHGVDNLAESGQNALLKTIEEPPADTVIILTVHDKTNVLQTIQSRTRTCIVRPVRWEHIESTTMQSTTDAKKHFYLSGGLPGLYASLESKDEHPAKSHMKLAKEIMSAPVYEKLARIDELTKSDINPLQLVTSLELIGSVLFEKQAQGDNRRQAAKLLQTRVHLQKAKKLLESKTNSKLVLTDLFLNL